MARHFIILGRGGHSRALMDVIKLNPGDTLRSVGHEGWRLSPDDLVVIGFGDLETRIKLYESWKHHIYDNGVQIMQNVTVYSSVQIGCNTLLNTGCQIDHDCRIGDHCIISPGAILCGGVWLGECCQIGAGAIILEGTKLNAGTKIPAGTLVVGQDDLRRPQRVLPEREGEG